MMEFCKTSRRVSRSEKERETDKKRGGAGVCVFVTY